jgi:hypothetical protein
MTENILSSKTKSSFLAFFLSKPYRYFSEIEIRRQVSGRNIKEDLSFLSKHDFILSFSRKGQRFYALNEGAFIDSQLRAELSKSARRYEDQLAKAISKIRGISFGVFTGFLEGYANLDCDILLVGQISQRSLLSFEKNVFKLLGQEIRYAVFTPKEFEYRSNIFDRFIKDVYENKHMVIKKK